MANVSLARPAGYPVRPFPRRVFGRQHQLPGKPYFTTEGLSFPKPVYCPDVSVAAKGKKGGKKGGKGKKGPGSLMDAVVPREPFENIEVVMLNLLMVESFRRNTGRIMLEDIEISAAAKTMWNADFAVVAYDRGVSEIPKIVYANKAALDLISLKWEDVYGKPASDFIDMDCAKLLEAHEKGAADSYEAKFATASGEVTITNADIWSIESPAAAGLEGEDDVDASKAGRGKIMGQGILFRTWNLPDGSAGGVGMASVSIPSPEEIAELEKNIKEQGDKIRALKDNGLTNQDPEVASAVADLLAMKESLAEKQALLGQD